MRVGLIASDRIAADRPLTIAYLDRLRRATGASPRFVAGSAEPLLIRLRAGELDLVIGEIAENSPWAADVTVIEPLAQRELGGRNVGLSPIASVRIWGRDVWLGWFMLAAQAYATIPPLITGHMELPLARRLRDKLLHTDR